MSEVRNVTVAGQPIAGVRAADVASALRDPARRTQMLKDVIRLQLQVAFSQPPPARPARLLSPTLLRIARSVPC